MPVNAVDRRSRLTGDDADSRTTDVAGDWGFERKRVQSKFGRHLSQRCSDEKSIMVYCCGDVGGDVF